LLRGWLCSGFLPWKPNQKPSKFFTKCVSLVGSPTYYLYFQIPCDCFICAYSLLRNKAPFFNC
jgi:hypothetical protein